MKNTNQSLWTDLFWFSAGRMATANKMMRSTFLFEAKAVR
jgi:hypothetical protein